MREITRSVKVALKCLIAVVLVDVDLLVAFAFAFSPTFDFVTFDF